MGTLAAAALTYAAYRMRRLRNSLRCVLLNNDGLR